MYSTPTSIRIFLSSTFKDMQDERDYLVNNIFPALRDVAEERGVPFSWCDLRFGVASFEEENIIRLCLNNIEICSPCFVGLLGGSYGSVPHNLTKEQIKRLSIFNGISSMIKNELGYTEMEIRYFISQRKQNDNFDFYFFIGESVESQSKQMYWKYRLMRSLAYLFRIPKVSDEDKLLSLKNYILKHNSQSTPYCWQFDLKEPVNDNIVYQRIKTVIENTFPGTQFRNEELIWNEQQTYYKSLLSEIFVLNNSEAESAYANSKDILNIYSRKATGKTYYVANLINRASNNGTICFYYFVGTSRCLDTPLSVWKCIMYQMCKFLNLDYGIYKGLNDIEDLRNVVNLLVQQISEDVLVAIDSFDNISCSIELKNTLISYFPAPLQNVKYVLSTAQKVLENKRLLCVEHKATKSIINEYVLEYLTHHYGYSYYNCSLSLGYKPTDLREARYCIDEAIANFDSNASNSLHTSNDIYGCITGRIHNNISRQISYSEGGHQLNLAKINNAIGFLSMTKYGILEADICKICDINVEQWTIIFSYLSPYFKSKGYIKLQDVIAERLFPKEHCDELRVRYIGNLKKFDKHSQYLTEILYQASQLSIECLLNEISDIKTLSFLYDTDKDLLSEYLLSIDKADSMIEFEGLLDNSLSRESVIERLPLLFKTISIFHEVLPRYAVASHYLEITNNIIANNQTPVEYQLDYYALKIAFYIEVGKYKEALGFLLSSNQIIQDNANYNKALKQYTIKNLFLKARLYDNDEQESNEKINAVEIYKELIGKYQENLDIDSYLYVLDRCIMLENKENRGKYVNRFASILNDEQLVKKNSHLFNKYALKLIIHKVCIKRFDAESKELDALISTYFRELDKHLQAYPYSQDNYNDMFYILELLLARINKLSNKNLYDNYKDNVISLQTRTIKFVDLTNLLKNKESIGYANAMFLSSRLYHELAYIFPLNKDKYIKDCIRYSNVAEATYRRINNRDSLIIARLYHNRAWAYTALSDYDNALITINKAIDIKTEFIRPNNDSLFKSKIRRISILIEKIIHTESLKSTTEEIELCYTYLSDLRIDTLNNMDLCEEEKKSRIISIEDIEKKCTLYVNDPKERSLVVANHQFEECKRLFKEAKRMLSEAKSGNTNVPLEDAFDNLFGVFKKAKDLKSYLDRFNLHQEFYDRYRDYVDFEDSIYKLCEVLDL